MPKINNKKTRNRYLKAKKELEKARSSMEHKEDALHDKIYRFNAAKKSRNFFEEEWKRLNEMLQKSRKLKNLKRTKKIEEEIAYLEKHIEEIDNRLSVLKTEIKEEYKSH